MSALTAYQLSRLILIIVLLIVAALLATPPNRLPLAMRGLMKILRKDAQSLGTDPRSLGTDPKEGVKNWRKMLAFLLVLLAAVLAVL